MNWGAINRWSKASWVCPSLTVLAMAAQAVPFLLWPASDAAARVAGVRLSSIYPQGYTITDYAKAAALDSAVFWGGLAQMLTGVFAVLALLRSDIPERVGSILNPRGLAWLVRIAFFVAIYLGLELIELPFRFCSFEQLKAFGLTVLTSSDWAKLLLVGLTVPLAIFVLKYILVTCTLPLCRKFWWIAAAVGLFVIGHLVPEVVSRDCPLDPVEKLEALKDGPHCRAMQRLLRNAKLNLPIMVVDQSRRSKSANICLTGRAGREYVLVTDTFLQQYSPDEVTVALAHELGHFRHKTRSLFIHKSSAFLGLLLTFGLAWLLSGRQPMPVSSAPRVVLVILLSGVIVSFVWGPISLAFSRREERFADRYALKLTGNAEPLARLLLKVAQNELAPLDLPRWRYYLSASHPTFLERMAECRK